MRTTGIPIYGLTPLVAKLDERPYESWLTAGAWFFAMGFGLNFLGQLMQIRALLGKISDKQ